MNSTIHHKLISDVFRFITFDLRKKLEPKDQKNVEEIRKIFEKIFCLLVSGKYEDKWKMELTKFVSILVTPCINLITEFENEIPKSLIDIVYSTLNYCKKIVTSSSSISLKNYYLYFLHDLMIPIFRLKSFLNLQKKDKKNENRISYFDEFMDFLNQLVEVSMDTSFTFATFNLTNYPNKTAQQKGNSNTNKKRKLTQGALIDKLSEIFNSADKKLSSLKFSILGGIEHIFKGLHLKYSDHIEIRTTENENDNSSTLFNIFLNLFSLVESGVYCSPKNINSYHVRKLTVLNRLTEILLENKIYKPHMNTQNDDIFSKYFSVFSDKILDNLFLLSSEKKIEIEKNERKSDKTHLPKIFQLQVLKLVSALTKIDHTLIENKIEKILSFPVSKRSHNSYAENDEYGIQLEQISFDFIENLVTKYSSMRQLDKLFRIFENCADKNLFFGDIFLRIFHCISIMNKTSSIYKSFTNAFQFLPVGQIESIFQMLIDSLTTLALKNKSISEFSSIFVVFLGY